MSSRHRAPLGSGVYVPAAGEASDVEPMPAGDVTDGVVRDAEGRDVLTFLPARCAGPVPEAWVQSVKLLVSVAQLLRRLHTALKDSFRTAMHWVPLRDPADAWPGWELTDPFRRLRIFADASGWSQDQRRRLPAFGVEATALSHQRMEHNARVLGGGWAQMWAPGSAA